MSVNPETETDPRVLCEATENLVGTLLKQSFRIDSLLFPCFVFDRNLDQVVAEYKCNNYLPQSTCQRCALVVMLCSKGFVFAGEGFFAFFPVGIGLEDFCALHASL